MSAIGWHLVLRLEGDRVFAPTSALRRRFARMFARLAPDFPLLAWRVVDTHLHLLGLFSEAEVGAIVRRVRLSLAVLHPGVPVHVARRIRVDNQWHLANCFDYILGQDEHHGVGNDPHQEASAVTDLLGMRTLGLDIVTRVRAHLPRVTREHLVPHLGVAALDEGAGFEHLKEAACAAFALPDLEGREASVVVARLAAVHAAGDARTSAIARALGVEPRTVQRLRASAPPPPLHLRAVRLQMAFRAARPDTQTELLA